MFFRLLLPRAPYELYNTYKLYDRYSHVFWGAAGVRAVRPGCSAPLLPPFCLLSVSFCHPSVPKVPLYNSRDAGAVARCLPALVLGVAGPRSCDLRLYTCPPNAPARRPGWLLELQRIASEQRGTVADKRAPRASSDGTVPTAGGAWWVHGAAAHAVQNAGFAQADGERDGQGVAIPVHDSAALYRVPPAAAADSRNHTWSETLLAAEAASGANGLWEASHVCAPCSGLTSTFALFPDAPAATRQARIACTHARLLLLLSSSATCEAASKTNARDSPLV